VAGVFKIKDTHAWFSLGEDADELGPIFLLLPLSLNNLDG